MVVSAKEAAIVTRDVRLKRTKFDYNQYLPNLDHIGQGNTSSTLDWSIDNGQDILISDDSDDGEEDIDESNNDAEDLDDYGSTVNEELVADVGAVSTLNIPPFRDFVKYIYRKMQGGSPEMPRIPDNISANHKELLEYALQILSANSRSQNFILSKDVLVPLSGIVNTVSPDVINKLSLTPVIKQESALPSFNVREESVKGILRDMRLALYPEYDEDQYAIPLMANLQNWIWRVLSVIRTSSDASSIVKRKLLVAVSYICTLLDSNQLAPTSTVCDESSLKGWLLSDPVHILLVFTKDTQSYANSVKQLMARTMHGPLPTTPPLTSRPLPPVLPALTTPPETNNKRHRRIEDSDEEPILK
ncbi:hypothetical protein BGX21_009388 [Mortierella sp. AD011]|nr:hypothetical protein BGX20_011161 [Mortierella sp. AD010]KAF9396820.1 hypothetical protein BGX21_009388 [Mortierella sp. AD011]